MIAVCAQQGVPVEAQVWTVLTWVYSSSLKQKHLDDSRCF